MAFRIETAARARFTVFILSGRIEKQAIAELERLVAFHTTDYRDIILDLKDVGVIDREVMRFFMCCGADGVTLENCASYIRECMDGWKGKKIEMAPRESYKTEQICYSTIGASARSRQSRTNRRRVPGI
jgi:hypothetical protein